PAFVLVLSAFSGTAFIRLIRKALSDLLDKTLEEELQFKIIKHLAAQESGYKRFHHVHSRKSGPKIFIEIGLGFDPNKKVGEAIAVIKKIKTGVETEIPNSTVNIIIKDEP
ncbi:MAG TPA: cation transporter dimerization domain-containing protein, partial [Elusimicrobiales bacterium]|nr:cation transporter dimerization domain-containing protein [Elusimicrobiales bacterium]